MKHWLPGGVALVAFALVGYTEGARPIVPEDFVALRGGEEKEFCWVDGTDDCPPPTVAPPKAKCASKKCTLLYKDPEKKKGPYYECNPPKNSFSFTDVQTESFPSAQQSYDEPGKVGASYKRKIYCWKKIECGKCTPKKTKDGTEVFCDQSGSENENSRFPSERSGEYCTIKKKKT